MASRSMWEGSISFGLVNILAKVYLATENRELSFNQLCPNGHRIQYKKWCPIDEEEIGYADVKKGYQVSKDTYIAIKEFIEAKELDPILIERSYYVAPDTKRGSVDEAYTLLVRILGETNKIAIGKVVFKDKEHVVALRPYQRGIVMHILHYLDDIRPVDEMEGFTNAQKIKKDNKEELSLGKLLVENLSSKHFDMSKYSDSYTKELKKFDITVLLHKSFISSARGKCDSSSIHLNWTYSKSYQIRIVDVLQFL